MKDCPSCGASVPDSAAQCPSCRHAFEEDELEKGRTLLGVPAEEVPSSPSDESSPEETDDTRASTEEAEEATDPTSTHFGLPSVEADAEESPAIDPSAEGPDEGVSDWSDLDGVFDEDSAEREAIEDGTEQNPDGEAPDEPAEGSDELRDEKKTHMGMPRFDPGRVEGKEGSSEENEGIGSGDTSPGAPGDRGEEDQEREDAGPEVEPTAEFSLETLKDQVEESSDVEGESSESGAETVSPSEDEADPSSTFHGKAARALTGSETSESGDRGEGPGSESDQTPARPPESEQPGIAGEQSSEPDQRATQKTHLGQPVQEEGAADPEARDDASDEEPVAEAAQTAERATDQESAVDGSVLPTPDQVGGASDSESREDSDPESGETPAEPFGGPTGFEVSQDSEEISVEGGEVDDVWGRQERDAGSRPTASPDEDSAGSTESDGPEVEPVEGLAPGSAPDDLFASIEEESSDAFAEEELEEVQHRADGDSVAEEFDFLAEEGDREPADPGFGAPFDEERTISEEQDTVQVERPDDLARPGYDLSGEAAADDAEGTISGESEESGSPPELDFDEPERSTPPETETADPTQTVPALDSVAQPVTGVIAGLVFAAFVAMQVTGGGALSHFLVATLTLAGGLGALVGLVLPFAPIPPGPRSGIYLGTGVLVSALSISTLVMVAQGLQVEPLIALCGGILAVAAGFLPTLSVARREG